MNELAEEIYNYCCAARRDNKTKIPKECCAPFDTLSEQAKHHYLSIAHWYLKKLEQLPPATH